MTNLSNGVAQHHSRPTPVCWSRNAHISLQRNKRKKQNSVVYMSFLGMDARAGKISEPKPEELLARRTPSQNWLDNSITVHTDQFFDRYERLPETCTSPPSPVKSRLIRCSYNIHHGRRNKVKDRMVRKSRNFKGSEPNGRN